MSAWRKCDTCRKVKPSGDFDGDSPTCTACRTTPAHVARKRSSAAVTTRKAAPRPEADRADRGPRLGAVGSGDLEVRERRARRAALEALAALHAEEFTLLLRDARSAEGLRPLSVDAAPTAPEEG